MKRKCSETRKERAARLLAVQSSIKGIATSGWPSEHLRYLSALGIVLILLSIAVIYAQTLRVPAIDYEDSFYLLHSPYVQGNTTFGRLAAIWSEPYFANFHPVTTTTWLIDHALSNKSFDALPFRATQLLYGVIGASLLIPLYRRLGIPAMLAVLGALVYAVHPIHTEVMAWLSARKDLTSLILILLSFLAWLWARAALRPDQWRIRHALLILLVLAAVLSKPIAVILPALFVAYEFCSGPHSAVRSWRWSGRSRHPLLTRILALTAIFLTIGVISTIVFRSLLARDSKHGGWLIFVSLILVLVMLAMAPAKADLESFLEGNTGGIRVLGPPFVVLSVVFGAGSAWTFWAQQQVGAIKGGLTLLPTLNLTFDVMLAYAGKAFVPARMSVSYNRSEFPYLSVQGLLGAALVCTTLWIAMRLAGSPDRNQRLIAFGIFWYLIALIPVSNLVPTSTKMADRYLFVPTVGSILVLLALVGLLVPASRRNQLVVCCAFVLIVIGYAGWSYSRTEVWCGKTTLSNDRPQPDLSLWAAAVEVNPEDTVALTNLGSAYLRLTPPEAVMALENLNRALEIGEASQSRIAGGKRLILSSVYEGLGDGYFIRASQIVSDKPESDLGQRKKDAYVNAAKFFRMAAETPSGFASDDARVLARLAESDEGRAQMDAQELTTVTAEQRNLLASERDQLRRESEDSLLHARQVLAVGNVSSTDSNYRMVIIGQGDIIFGREVGASNEERSVYYHEALRRYKDAALLLPDDPRPILYQGLCYERLTLIAKSPDEKQQQFALGEAALRKALTLNLDSADYSQALPYRALAVLYSHMNDYHSALEALRNARQADPAGAESANLDREIQSVQQYLAEQEKRQ